MDSQLLRTALLVARTGSFASAARDTGVDPSSVSRQVAALEDQLGVRLFERTTRRLDLTEAGRVYVERVAAALDVMDEAADAARDVLSEPSGLLRVTTSVAFGERWLIPRVALFRAEYPKIELELLLSDSMVDLAGEGVDLALRLGPQPATGSVVTARLFATRYRVVASPEFLKRHGTPVRPEDLQNFDGVHFRLPSFRSAWHFRSSPTSDIVEALPRATLTISNALAIRRAALSGMGVALMANWTIADDLAEGTLVDIFPDFEVSAGQFDSAAWIVYLSRSYVPVRLRAFIDHLRRTPTGA